MTLPNRPGLWARRISEVLETGLLLLDEAGEVTVANRTARDLLGDDGELQQSWDAVRRRAEAATGAPLTEAADDGPLKVEVAGPEDGDPRTLLLEVVAVAEEDCRGHLVQVRDRDGVRRVERDRLLASQMHSISRLYRAMAHDLRSPLNAMVVNLELLTNAVESSLDDDGLVARRRRYVGVLKEEVERLNRLLQAFLSGTSPVSDRVRRFDVAATVRDVAAFVEPQARKQDTHVSVRLPEAQAESEGHADPIRSAFLALVVNALEALEDDGGEIELGVAVDGSDVVLWVDDDGPGVPQERRRRIFDLHATTRPAGTGIGLPVARRVAQDHGGALELVDRPGPGARFEMRLPRWTQNQDQDQES